ncbi:MAG: hypothetical protein WCF24_02675 [Acidimicrobiales bacterium]
MRRRSLIGALTALFGASLALIAPLTASAAARPRQAECSVPVANGVSFPAATWQTCFGGSVAESSPSVATYHGTTILAVGDEQGYVHVINATTGAELPGWPQRMKDPGGGVVAIEGSPAIGFLNGPNKPPSIIVGTGSRFVKNTQREVEAFTLKGRVRWLFHVGQAAGTAPGVLSSPAVGSLTGGPQQDVVFGAWDHNIYALNAKGKLLSGFPVNTADTIWSSPALYHLPGMTGDTIFIGGDASGLDGCVGGWVSAYHDTNGKVGLVWRHCEDQTIWSSPAVGVINSTGRAVVVVGTGYYEQPFTSATNKLFAFYAASGKPVPGWPVTAPGPAVNAPAIGQISATGAPDVVESTWSCQGVTIPSCLATNRSGVSAWTGNGHMLWTTPLRGSTVFSSPILAPLSPVQPWNDVLVGSPYGLYAIDGSTGHYMFGTTNSAQHSAINFTCRVDNSAAFSQVENDGANEGWYVFEACGGPEEFHHIGEIVGYHINFTPALANAAWPMFHQDAEHLGVAIQTHLGLIHSGGG